MTPAAACRRRLGAQYLMRPARGSAADVVRALVAVQAQDYPGAKWALGQRVHGATDAGVEAELAAGRILRTHVLRPTWHFVAPDDIRWLLRLTGPRVAAAMASYNRKMGLTPAVFARSHDTIARALEDGRQLTRAELAAALSRAGISASGQKLAHLMMQAELDAVVCSGGCRGRQFTYALLDDVVPPSPPRDRDQALGELASRYFTTRGPATLHDFTWWSGLTVADGRRGIEIAGRALRGVEVDGRPCWITGGEHGPARPTSRALLLPNYDEYFIGLRDRSAIGSRVGGLALVTGGDIRITHVAFVDGQLVGAWRRAQGPDGLAVELQPLARLTRVERARLAEQADRLGAFLGLPAEVRWQTARL